MSETAAYLVSVARNTKGRDDARDDAWSIHTETLYRHHAAAMMAVDALDQEMLAAGFTIEEDGMAIEKENEVVIFTRPIPPVLGGGVERVRIALHAEDADAVTWFAQRSIKPLVPVE